MTHDGQLGGDEQVVIGVVQVAVVAQKDLLAALGNHAKDRIVHAVDRLRGRGGAVETQAPQRLHFPVFADGARDTLDQLVAVGLSSAVALALYRWRFIEST